MLKIITSLKNKKVNSTSTEHVKTLKTGYENFM